MTFNEQVSPYNDFKYLMGFVRSVFSSQTLTTCDYIDDAIKFNLIVDSGCTRHMFPYNELFISYRETPSSFVILADKSRVLCLGSGTAQFFLHDRAIIGHDVLHVPKL
jgi:hypothetical protein